MKHLLPLLFMLVILAVGCGRPTGGAAPTPLPPPPTAMVVEADAPDARPSDESPALPLAPTAADTPSPAVAPPTAEPPTAQQPPTEAPSLAPPPTEAPSPESPPAVSTIGSAATEAPPIEAPPAPPPPAADLFAPGQRGSASLAAGEAMAFLVDGRAFQPYILFVESSNELNVALAAYVGDQTGQTTPEGVTPPVTADNALAGRPEILVYSPESAGLFTLVVRAVAGEGAFIAHLFDLVTPAPGVVVQQAGALAAGAEEVYLITSNGPRPIIVAADPTDQSDIALDILSDDGTLLTTANYSGAGGVETAYVLPLGTTSYLVKVREVNGGESSYQILIIALE